MRMTLVLLMLGWATEAAAQLSVIRVPKGDGPQEKSKLSLESASTTIECKERGAEILCELEARYVIRNLADDPESAWLFFSAPGYAPEIQMYEGPSLTPMKSVSDELFDLANGLWRRGDLTGFFDTLQTGRTESTSGAMLWVEAKQRVTITVRCETRPIREYTSNIGNSLIEERHRALAPEWHDELFFHITPESALDWAVVGGATFSLVVPTRWEATYDPEIPIYQREEDGRQQRLTFLELAPSDVFSMRFIAAPPILQGGGPVFGFGASLTKEPFLFRTGYEAGTSRSFGPLVALLMETNFRSRAALVPQLGLGLARMNRPSRPDTPTMSLFLGMPFLIEREQALQVGVRTQLDATWGPIGLSLPLDIYPESENPLRFSVLGQFSF